MRTECSLPAERRMFCADGCQMTRPTRRWWNTRSTTLSVIVLHLKNVKFGKTQNFTFLATDVKHYRYGTGIYVFRSIAKPGPHHFVDEAGFVNFAVYKQMEQNFPEPEPHQHDVDPQHCFQTYRFELGFKCHFFFYESVFKINAFTAWRKHLPGA
jgi:hypothetical protein